MVILNKFFHETTNAFPSIDFIFPRRMTNNKCGGTWKDKMIPSYIVTNDHDRREFMNDSTASR